MPLLTAAEISVEVVSRKVMRRTNGLKLHPSLLKQNLWPTNERLLKIAKNGNAIFEQPLLVTQEELIIDGYARWKIASKQ
jgi:hypothetical protein